MPAAKNIIQLAEAERPDFRPSQVDFCKDLIGMGLTHLTIISLVMSKNTTALDHAEVAAGRALIQRCRKELGYGVMDARHAQTDFMQAAVRQAASKYRLKFRIA